MSQWHSSPYAVDKPQPRERRTMLRSHMGVDFTKLDNYIKHGGFEAWKKALELGPEKVHEMVRAVNLRGRGGAGFPAGVKWGFLPKNGRDRVLVINTDEGEPGTFKDRYIVEDDPFLLFEGCLIASYTFGAHLCYNYLRGEFWKGTAMCDSAVEQMYSAGLLGKNIGGTGFDLEITNHRGAGAYICGEETALIESLEGKPGQPRLKPPFPANVGAFGLPTIVNNTETIASVPLIINLGVHAFNALGTPGNEATGAMAQGGSKLIGISGHVKNPGVFEAELGITLRECIYDLAGGILDDREPLAVIPGGASCPLILPEDFDVPMDFDSPKSVGSMFGTAGIMVMHDGTDILEVMNRIATFFQHESCGQCTPCRQGTGWMLAIVRKMVEGSATPDHVDVLYDAATQIEGNTICAFGDAAAWPIKSFLDKFRDRIKAEVIKRAEAGGA